MRTLRELSHVEFEFMCSKCHSVFVMTEAERLENDRKYNESKFIDNNNPENWFDCPVCNTSRTMARKSIHKVIVYKDGSKWYEY